MASVRADWAPGGRAGSRMSGCSAVSGITAAIAPWKAPSGRSERTATISDAGASGARATTMSSPIFSR
ncbi:hypothetical protein D3C72_768030 [compost metagenome]